MTAQDAEPVGGLLASALRYAGAGWPVLPVIPGEKVPATPHGFHDASTDPDRITSWWKASPGRNVGIATGAPGPDVLDVDRHPDGSGFPAYNRLIREGLVPRPLAIVRTPGGGIHAYYRGTDQRNGHIPTEHIDFRSQGGYVVAPPSAVGGRRYLVAAHEPGEATFDWDAVRRLLDPQPERSSPAREPGADGPRDVTHLAGWVAAQPEGNRNAGLFWAACRAAEVRDAGALDGIARGARAAGLDDREIDRTIRSAQRTAEQRPFDSGAQPERTGGQEMFGRKAAREREAAEHASQLAAEAAAEREERAERRAERQRAREGSGRGPEAGAAARGVSYDPESGSLTITGARISSGRIGGRGGPDAESAIRSAERTAREAGRAGRASPGQTVISAGDQVTITGSRVAGQSVSITGSDVTVDGSWVGNSAGRDTEPEAG